MADEPIRASLNVVLDDVTVRRPAPPDTYLGVANAMMPGVEQLAAARPCCHLAHALVASHVLECTLKACLSCNGDDRDLKDHALRHNLVELWGKAQQAGLDIPPTPPDWVKFLSQIHGSRPHRAETTEKTKARVSGPCLVMLANIASGLRWRLYECVGPSSGRDASRYGPPPDGCLWPELQNRPTPEVIRAARRRRFGRTVRPIRT